MDFNLYSQNLLIFLAVLSSAASVYLLMRYHQKKSKRHSKKYNKWWVKLSVISILLAIIIHLVFKLAFPHDKLPTLLWLMLLPVTFSICLLILYWHRKISIKLIAIGTVIISFCFSGVLVNNYYHYYPSLKTLLGLEANIRLPSDDHVVTIRFNPKSHDNLDQLSIERSSSLSPVQSTNGKVYSLDIPGKISKFKARTAQVYVPSVSFLPQKINLPVIVLLSGVPGSTKDWLNGGGIEATMNAFALRHKGVTPIIVMVDDSGTPNNDTECTDSPRGNVETYLTQDVPNFIKSYFDTLDDPSNWAIGGFSDGGLCSIMLALVHPNVYHYFLDFGGESAPEIGTKQQTIQALFHGSEAVWAAHQPELLLQNHKFPYMGGFFAVGSSDNKIVVNSVNQLYIQSKAAGIDAIVENMKGEHTFKVWQQAYKDALPWLSNRIGATACGISCF